ncbi:AbrB/MazE/SpoVT family DNA-binding domain-containing protein [Verrucomicrobia bacterium]|nr:AbrB/MazE/SpoVT family DNA-binding domain-containing protein [Verrucomicrobiota bacterium]
MKASITSKGQLTVPKSIRDRMGHRAGDVLEFDEKRMRSVAGRGRKDNALLSKELLDDMRGPVELP